MKKKPLAFLLMTVLLLSFSLTAYAETSYAIRDCNCTCDTAEVSVANSCYLIRAHQDDNNPLL